jgi:hypothetical protein
MVLTEVRSLPDVITGLCTEQLVSWRREGGGLTTVPRPLISTFSLFASQSYFVQVLHETWPQGQNNRQSPSSLNTSKPRGNYWLLSRGGIIQSVPCNCDHFVIYRTIHLEFYSFPIHPPECSALVAAETPSREAGRKWARNGRRIVRTSSSILPQGIFDTP